MRQSVEAIARTINWELTLGPFRRKYLKAKYLGLTVTVSTLVGGDTFITLDIPLASDAVIRRRTEIKSYRSIAALKMYALDLMIHEAHWGNNEAVSGR